MATCTLETLAFDNRQLRELPVDERGALRTPRPVPNAVFARAAPTPLARPALVAHSQAALELLGLAATEAARGDFAEFLGGNRALPGSAPAAHCYAGHQFGHFSGQLGDGATMYLGEVAPPGRARVELQFKGAGLTPFSRTADGRKVLRSSLREFLCSELMHALGVPTTRAGSVVTSDTTVARDVFYSGHPAPERCTVITRLAPSFLRFGSLEVVRRTDPETGRAGPSAGNTALLETLLGYACRHLYPAVQAAHSTDGARWAAMFAEVVRRTAALAAQWQAHGWCHGVLNTDNMSLVGVTLDYGPFGWMDRYDPAFVCNASDSGGRYSFANQPGACRWNCVKLGEVFAMSPAVQQQAAAAAGGRGAWDYAAVVARVFDAEFDRAYYGLMRRKLGLGFSAAAAPSAAQGGAGGGTPHNDGASSGAMPDEENPMPDEEDRSLLAALLETMRTTGADYTNTFRGLMRVHPLGHELRRSQRLRPQRAPATSSSAAAAGAATAAVDGDDVDGGGDDPALAFLLAQTASARELAAASQPTIPLEKLTRLLALAEANPGLGIDVEEVRAELRKHTAWAALRGVTDAAKAASDARAWRAWLARYRARLAVEVPPRLHGALPALVGGAPSSTSPAAAAAADDELRRLARARHALMAHANPKYVLRNWIAQRVIVAAEAGDYGPVRELLARLQDPYGLHDVGALEPCGLQEDDARAAAGAAVASGSRSGGAIDYAARPPPDLLDLKVT